MAPLRYFTFAGKDSRDYITWINKIKRPYLPGITVPSYPVPNRAGSIPVKRNEIAPSTIEITFTLGGASHAEIRARARNLAAFLFYNEDQEIVFSDELDKKYFARFNQEDTNFEEIAYTGQGTLLFTCFDPIAYSTTEKTQLIAGIESVFINTGTYKAFPRIRVLPTADFTYLTITNVTTGQQLIFNGNPTWPANNPIVFDNSTNQVYHDTSKVNYIKNLSLGSEFFPLEVGPNTLRIENQNVDNAGLAGSMRLYWRERFL